MRRLGVNIDHIATLREARQEGFPDIIRAARICERYGADSIVCHLRQDRRHIQDKDLPALKRSVKGRFNLEMSAVEEIVRIAISLRPDQATIVPEKRQELTTEGGLDVIRYMDRLTQVISRLKKSGIVVSLFIDPVHRQIEAAKDIGSDYIELHTGRYANARTRRSRDIELKRIDRSAEFAAGLGLGVNAGHGLDYENVGPVAAITLIEEMNIGFSIVSESVFIGLPEAVKRMKARIS